MATKSMVEMVRFLLRSSPKGVFVLTRLINQDPLEAFFSRVRRMGGSMSCGSMSMTECPCLRTLPASNFL